MGAVAAGASRLFLFRFTYLYVAMNNAFQLGRHGPWVVLAVRRYHCLCLLVLELRQLQCTQERRSRCRRSGGRPAGHLGGFVASLLPRRRAVKARLTRLTGGVVRGTGNLLGLVPALTLVNIPSAVSSGLAIVIAIVSV